MSVRFRLLAPAAALTAGAAVGILAALLVTVSDSAVHALYLVLAAGWAWAALAFCVGLSRHRRMGAVILATVSLLTAVIGYYLTKLTQGEFLEADMTDPSGRTYISWLSFWSKTVVWGVAALVTGPLLGLAGNLARSRGIRGLPFRVLIPVVAVVDTSVRLESDAPLQGPVAATTWNGIRILAVFVIVVLVGHSVATGWSRRAARDVRR